MKITGNKQPDDLRHAVSPKGVAAVHLTRHWLRLVLLALGILLVALAVSGVF